jgi:flagellar biosynthesis/type III secretory pathway M-ring protein FliF/YscJ
LAKAFDIDYSNRKNIQHETMTSSIDAKLGALSNNVMIIAAAGVLIGFVIGRVTAKPSNAVHEQDSKKLEDRKQPRRTPQDEDEDSDQQNEELQDFTGNNEECKLVLVVRTDLGMTKGTSYYDAGISVIRTNC